jgi:DNA polymerase-3 subunit alpha
MARFQMAGVLLKKQERVSQKSGNKFAFLQLSDSTGVYEVMLFSELLAQTRSILEPGAMLLLTVEAELREEQVRFTTQKIEPLEAALEGKIREVQIHLSSPAGTKKLKEFLDVEGHGMAQVRVFAKIDDEAEAEMLLPGRWSLSAQARNILRTTAGVQSVSEL